MKISYNTSESVGSTTSSRISEIWFSKTGFSSGAWTSWDICYKINKTSLGIAPHFPYLMEYNRYDQDDIKLYTDEEKTGGLFNYELGECLILSEVTISKVIFPKKLLSEGYRYAVIFDQISDDPAFKDWYISHTSTHVEFNQDSPELLKMQDWFNNRYKYRVYVTPEDSAILGRDTVIQFMTAASSESTETDIQVLTAVHESNYSNPHLEQITSLSTQNLGGNIVSSFTFNQTYKTPNAFLVGNQMFNEDFSMRYIGDYLYLVDEYTVSWDPEEDTWSSSRKITDATGKEVYLMSLLNGQTGLMHIRFNPPNTRVQLADFELYSVALDGNNYAGHGTPLEGSAWTLIQDALSSDCEVRAPGLSEINPPQQVCVCLKDNIDEYFYVQLGSQTISGISLTLNGNL